MANPFAADERTKDVDWDSFLDMGMLEEISHPGTAETTNASESNLMLSEDSNELQFPMEDIRMDTSDCTIASSSIKQADYTGQETETGDAEDQCWSQIPTATQPGALMYAPNPPPPSRYFPSIDTHTSPHLGQIQTIDSISNDSRSLVNSEPGYPNLMPMDTEMYLTGDWNVGDMQQPPLGSFVQPTPAHVGDSYSPLVPPYLFDPAVMGQSRSEQIDHTLLSQGVVNQHPQSHYERALALEVPHLDLHLQNALFTFDHNDGSQSRSSQYQHIDQTFPLPPPNSPNTTFLQEIPFSPLPLPNSPNTTFHQKIPFSPPPPQSSPPTSPLPTSPLTKSKSRARSLSFTPQPNIQGPCLTCGRNYRTSTSPGRCARCGLKWERHTAGPPTYTLDPTVPSLEAARQLLYPISRGRQRPDDDVHSVISVPGSQDFWVRKWMDDISTPVTNPAEEEAGAKASWAMNQQTTFNQKAKMDREGEFSPAFVTARMRALWWEVVVFHGGGISLYPVGGDSMGYPEDLELRFGERLEAIGDVMRVDKRTVMDVVEGRGVGAFVGNPWGFHKRKDSNNGCNVKKKDVLKRVLGDARTAGRRNRGRKKASRGSSVGVADDGEGSRREEDDDEDFDPDGRPVEMME